MYFYAFLWILQIFILKIFCNYSFYCNLFTLIEKKHINTILCESKTGRFVEKSSNITGISAQSVLSPIVVFK